MVRVSHPAVNNNVVNLITYSCCIDNLGQGHRLLSARVSAWGIPCLGEMVSLRPIRTHAFTELWEIPKNFTQVKLISTSWGEAIIPFNQVMFMILTTP